MSADRTVIAVFSKDFTDDPLAARSTPLKVLHFTELRDAINTLRGQQGLGAFAWTGTVPAPGGTVRGTHLTDLRTALTEAYQAAGRVPVPTYTDPTVMARQTVSRPAISTSYAPTFVRWSAESKSPVFRLVEAEGSDGKATHTGQGIGVPCRAAGQLFARLILE